MNMQPPPDEGPCGSLRGLRTTPHDRHYWILLACAVAVVYGPLALLNQPLWDDWVLRAHAQAGTLWELSSQAGTREVYPLAALFSSVPWPRAVVITELVLFCAMAPLIYEIIRRTTRWPAQDAFWAALLTALVPLNQARFVLSTLLYGISCFCFALSLVLLLRDLEVPASRRRVLSALLMVLAFATNSFLVLGWIAPLIVAIDGWRAAAPASSPLQRFGAAARSVMGRAELLLLPPVYWAAKKILEPTYGIYANYNKLQMDAGSALIQTFSDFFAQFDNVDLLLPARQDLAQLCLAALAITVLFGLLIRVWRLPIGTRQRPASEKRPGRLRALIAVSLLLISVGLVASALFPYTIVGKPPRFNGLWETRNQTTLMMVSGFVIFVVLRLVVPRPLLAVAAAAICAGFLTIDLSVTHRLLADAMEARAISTVFRREPSPPGTMLLVIENDRDYRALGRHFPFYELSYLINSPETGFSRLAISNREILDPATGTYPVKVGPEAVKALVQLCETHRSHPQFGFMDFVSNGQIEVADLVAASGRPGPFRTLVDAVRSLGGQEPTPAELVRIERTTAPIGGVCTAPCCRG
jgi:hypothetical protein